MIFLLSLVAVSVVFAGPINQQENENLQRTCGITYTRGRHRRSMNTQPATRHAAPFTVLIHRSTKVGTPEQRLTGSSGICTGTIISPRHILTAAHCMGNYNCGNDGTFYFHRSKHDKKYRQKLNYFFASAPTSC